MYDLTVADAHEFYANGLLVHNCTWRPSDAVSPGRLDASVYLAYHLLPVPGAETVISSATGLRKDAPRAPRRRINPSGRRSGGWMG